MLVLSLIHIASAEDNLKAHPAVARFVLPICTTINMNGCAAFILVTSLFVMQNAGMELTVGTMVAWLFTVSYTHLDVYKRQGHDYDDIVQC